MQGIGQGSSPAAPPPPVGVRAACGRDLVLRTGRATSPPSVTTGATADRAAKVGDQAIQFGDLPRDGFALRAQGARQSARLRRRRRALSSVFFFSPWCSSFLSCK
jgi:hypothetical protein